MISALTPKKPLWMHQQAGVEAARDGQSWAFLYDVGTGKTPMAIQIMREHFASMGGVQTTVVLAPLSLLNQWKAAILEWSNIADDAVVIVAGTAATKLRRVSEGRKRIVVVNYEACRSVALWCAIEALRPSLVIMDEAHKLKDHKSMASKAVRRLSAHARRILLTGTPVGGKLLDIFGIAQQLNTQLLGSNFFGFRGRYFHDLNAAWASRGSHFPNWQPLPGAEVAIMDRLKPQCLQARAKDCIDLPELVVNRVIVDPPEKIKRKYVEMEKDWVMELDSGEKIAVEFAMVKALRLRQVACGFIQDTSTEASEWLDDFRIDALVDVVAQIPDDESVIVWAPFKMLYPRIVAALEKAGRTVTTLTGDDNSEAKFKAEQAFKNREFNTLVSNPQAGGVGLNFQVARHAIWFAHGYNAIEHTQAMARNYRGGSIDLHQKVVHWHLLARLPIDFAIYEVLQGKKNLIDAIVDMVQSYKK